MAYKIIQVSVTRGNIVEVIGKVGGIKKDVRKIILGYQKMTPKQKQKEWIAMLGVEKIEVDNTKKGKAKGLVSRLFR